MRDHRKDFVVVARIAGWVKRSTVGNQEIFRAADVVTFERR